MKTTQLQPIDLFIDQNAVWSTRQPVHRPEWKEGGTPYATHEGVLTVFDLSIRVARLNTGQAIIHADDFHALLAHLGMTKTLATRPQVGQDG